MPGISHHSAWEFSFILFVFILMLYLHLGSMNLHAGFLIQPFCKENFWTFLCTVIGWLTPPYLNFQSAWSYTSTFREIWYLQFLSVSNELQHESPYILLASASCRLRVYGFLVFQVKYPSSVHSWASKISMIFLFIISPPILFDFFPMFYAFQFIITYAGLQDGVELNIYLY